MCVPLITRGRTLGVISFVAAESERRYGPDDLTLAEDLARRAGTAIENAQLYREAEERAEAARVLENVGDGVFLVDLEGILRLWNHAAEVITKLPREEVVGPKPMTCCRAGRMSSERFRLRRSPGPAVAKTLPFELNGEERWLSISGVGFDEGTVYAFRDHRRSACSSESARTSRDGVARATHTARRDLRLCLTLTREDIQSRMLCRPSSSR